MQVDVARVLPASLGATVHEPHVVRFFHAPDLPARRVAEHLARGFDLNGAAVQRVARLIDDLLEKARAWRGKALRVRDDGGGIDPLLLPHVFERFVQDNCSMVSSSAAQVCDLQVSASVEPGAPATHRILVVDDSHDAAQSLGEALELMGHTVRVVHDGREALAVAPELEPDIALLDIALPDMNGYEICERLGALLGEAAPTCIALTGYSMLDEHELSRASFFAHFVKPIDLDQLESALSAVPVSVCSARPQPPSSSRVKTWFSV